MTPEQIHPAIQERITAGSLDLMVDATQASLNALRPWAQDITKVAGYVTGAGIAWTAQEWNEFPRAGHVRIDQSPGIGVPYASDVKDCERYAASIPDGVAWSKARSQKSWWSFLYNAFSSIDSLRAAIHNAKLSAVMYWVADWNWSQTEALAYLDAHSDTAAVQFASATSNPNTLIPGTNITLGAANVDLSVTRTGWFDFKAPQPPTASKTGLLLPGVTSLADLAGAKVVKSADGKNWS